MFAEIIGFLFYLLLSASRWSPAFLHPIFLAGVPVLI
jgi:hypothetical protein